MTAARDPGPSSSGWESVEPSLLPITFDQLRTLLALHDRRTPARAAEALRRDQSSTTKQLDTLNAHFRALCGEPLARRDTRARGRDLVFTRTGEAVVELARSLFVSWGSELHRQRQALGRSLSIGATSFILDFFPPAWNRVVRSLENQGVDFSIRQIHTDQVLTLLHEPAAALDLILGGLILERGVETIENADLELLAWDRQPFVLVTNYPEDVLPDEPISAEQLSKLPLLLPNAGIVKDFLVHWYGDSYHTRLNAREIVGDVPFNLALLRSGSIEACVIVPAFLSAEDDSDRLRSVPLHDSDLAPIDAVACLIVRRGDRADRAPDNPLNVVWRLFVDWANERTDPDSR